jgi:Oxidoreductase molybdopterin binding domain
MSNLFRNIITSNKKLSTEAIIAKKTLLSFCFFTVAVLVVFLAWKWINRQPEKDGMLSPLRAAAETNEAIFGRTKENQALAKTYPVSAADKNVRVNGGYGLKNDADTANWRLQVVKKNGDTLRLTLKEIQALPKTDIVFDFKCIEGWNQVTHWGGVTFADFVKHYGLDAQAQLKYIGLNTPKPIMWGLICPAPCIRKHCSVMK